MKHHRWQSFIDSLETDDTPLYYLLTILIILRILL